MPSFRTRVTRGETSSPRACAWEGSTPTSAVNSRGSRFGPCTRSVAFALRTGPLKRLSGAVMLPGSICPASRVPQLCSSRILLCFGQRMAATPAELEVGGALFLTRGADQDTLADLLLRGRELSHHHHRAFPI